MIFGVMVLRANCLTVYMTSIDGITGVEKMLECVVANVRRGVEYMAHYFPQSKLLLETLPLIIEFNENQVFIGYNVGCHFMARN